MTRPRVRLVVGLLVLSFLASPWAAPALHAGDEPAADLDLVPADAVLFAHVRLADIWKSEHFKDWRDTVLKAGQKALAAFDRRFVPAPSSIDRVTVVATRNNDFQREPDILFILATTKPIDQTAFLKQTAPGAEQQQVGGKTFYESRMPKIGFYFVGDRTLVFGPAESVHRSLRQPAARQGDLAPALKQARAGKPLVVAVNAAALAKFVPPQALEQIPPPFRPLAHAKLALLTLDFAGHGQVDLRLTYANADQADQAAQAAQDGLKMARTLLAKKREELTLELLGNDQPGTLEELPGAATALFGLGALNRLDEFLAAPPLERDGSALHVSLKLPEGGSTMLSMGAISTALLVPAVQKVREAAARTQDQNNLKQLVLALINYADTKRGVLPPAAICDNDGKPLLSWRVAILPYIEQDELYRRFKLDEPWDSEHNRQLIPLMPTLYAIPAIPGKPGETHYRVFVGGGAAFDLAKPVRWPAGFTDGTSNTLFIVQTADSVPWTKPDDPEYDAKKPLPRLGTFYRGSFHAAFADGSVRVLSADLPEQVLRALITRAGGEVIRDLP